MATGTCAGGRSVQGEGVPLGFWVVRTPEFGCGSGGGRRGTGDGRSRGSDGDQLEAEGAEARAGDRHGDFISEEEGCRRAKGWAHMTTEGAEDDQALGSAVACSEETSSEQSPRASWRPGGGWEWLSLVDPRATRPGRGCGLFAGSVIPAHSRSRFLLRPASDRVMASSDSLSSQGSGSGCPSSAQHRIDHPS